MYINFLAKFGIASVICFVSCYFGQTAPNIHVDNLATNNGTNNATTPSMTPSLPSLNDKWKPANFKGLIIGKSSEGEMLKIFGKPISIYEMTDDLPDNAVVTEWSNEYQYIGEFPGKLVISTSKKTGVVTDAIIYPENLYLETAISIYGDNFRKTSYRFMECPGDTGASAIKETPGGELEYIEYRSKGIVILADYQGKKVQQIDFVSGPIGKTSCSQRDTRIVVKN